MNITVQQASKFTVVREDVRQAQDRFTYNDLAFYCLIDDFNQLAKCNGISYIEEWLLGVQDNQNDKGAELVITGEDKKVFTLSTIVGFNASQNPSIVQTPLSKEAFLQLKNIGLSGYSFRRNRFDIPYTDSAWLVDIYKDYMGNDHPWVRVTLAMNEPLEHIPDLPFNVAETIYERSEDNAPEQIRKIKNLWKNEWCMIDKA